MEPAVVLKGRGGIKRRKSAFCSTGQTGAFCSDSNGQYSKMAGNDTAVHGHMYVCCEQAVNVDCAPTVHTYGPHDKS